MATLPESESAPGNVIDIVVIGAGPAGLAAAVAAADAGASVALIDAEPGVGGQFWRHPSASDEPDALQEKDLAYLHHDLGGYRRLRSALEAHSAHGRIRHLSQHEVWAVSAATENAGARHKYRFVVRVTNGVSHGVHAGGADGSGGGVAIYTRSVILATGAYDLQVPFPGWDLPGVMTAGGVQSLLKGHGVVAGKRIAVAGTGPFLLSVAAGLARGGARVVGVFEANSPTRWLTQPRGLLSGVRKVSEGAGYAATLARRRIRYRTGWTVIRANGDSVLRSVTVAPLDRDGAARTADERTIAVDTLAVGWGFAARLELPLMLGCRTATGDDGLPIVTADARQHSSVPGVYVAGEITGIGGAQLSVVEGEIAGTAAAFAIARKIDEEAVPGHMAEFVISKRLVYLARRRANLRGFASALAKAYPVPRQWLNSVEDTTVVCRCEEVSAGEILEVARRDGAADARTVKLLARPGMGWCQGRICEYATAEIAAFESGSAPIHSPTPRPIAVPVPLGQLGQLNAGSLDVALRSGPNHGPNYGPNAEVNPAPNPRPNP